MTAKKLSPERLAEIFSPFHDGLRIPASEREAIRSHIEALEAELKVHADVAQEWANQCQRSQKELAESRAELEELHGKLAGRPATGLQCGMNYEDAYHSMRKAYYAVSRELRESKAECERLRDELGRVRRLSELGWDVTEVGALKAQLHDRDTLLKNENENYRRVNEECERLRVEVERLRVQK